MAIVNVYGDAASVSPVSAVGDFHSTQYLPALQALLPPGQLWTRESDAELTNVLTALAYELARIDRRGRRLLKEADPRQARELIDEWEAALGLPGDCQQPSTLLGRQQAVTAKDLGFGDPTAALYLEIAAALGLTEAQLIYYAAAVAEQASAGDPLYSDEWAFVSGLYHAIDPGTADDLWLCLVREIAPVHTVAVLRHAYETWWEAANTFGATIRGLAWGHEKWVAVGDNGSIRTSDNLGSYWVQQTPDAGYSADFKAITWNGSQFVAVGELGEIQTSPDGETWTQQTPDAGFGGAFRGVAWDGSIWVIAGDFGEVQTSPDGSTWTQRTSGTADTLQCLAYGAGVFVAAGNNGTIIYSSNGTSWSAGTPAGGFSDTWFRAQGTPTAVLLGSLSDPNVQRSTDGASWTDVTPGGNPSGNVTSFAHDTVADLVLVNIGSIVHISEDDGVSWASLASQSAAYGAAFDGGEKVCFASLGSANIAERY